MFIAVYVDDLILFGADIDFCIDDVILNLQDKLWMIDFGDVFNKLRIKIDVDLMKNTINLQ